MNIEKCKPEFEPTILCFISYISQKPVVNKKLYIATIFKKLLFKKTVLFLKVIRTGHLCSKFEFRGVTILLIYLKIKCIKIARISRLFNLIQLIKRIKGKDIYIDLTS